MVLKVGLSYAPDREQALQGALDQWRAPVLESSVQTMLRTPQQFDAAAKHVTAADLEQHVRISADPGEHAAWLAEDEQMGFSQVILHNVNRWQERFIEDFGRSVLPQVRGTATS